jgi:hypothetical protein
MTRPQHTLRVDVQHFLERYGASLSGGDYQDVAACWETPALVIDDSATIPVAKASEIERFFGTASKAYHERGIVATRPEIVRLEPTTERIVTVDVRWTNLDSEGAEKGSETSRYVLRADDEGRPRIRVAMTLDHGHS